jgi:two-component system NarL family sensor kinase
MAVDSIAVALDDQLAPLTPPRAWHDGGTVVYTILRDGDSVDVNVTLHRLSPPGILRGLWHAMQDTPAEWSWSLVAIAVFLLRPRDRAAHLLLLIGVSHGAVTKLGFASTTISSNFAPPVVYYTQLLTGWFWGTLFWPSIILLALSFPLRIYPLTRWPRAVPALLYGLPLALTLLMLVTNQIMLATLVLASEAVLMFVAFGAAFFNALKRSRDAVARAQALWVIFGFMISIGLVLPVYLLAYVGVVDPNSFEWIYNFLSPLTALALPVSLGIAITRYRLFDIDVIVRKTLVYSVLTLLLALVYFGSVVLIQ